MSDQGGSESISIGFRVESDPVKAALIELERRAEKTGEAMGKAAKKAGAESEKLSESVGKVGKGMGGAEEGANNLAKRLGHARSETGGLIEGMRALAGWVAVAFSVQRVAEFIVQLQKARDEAGKIGEKTNIETTQSALSVNLSQRNESRLRSIQHTVRTTFNPQETKAVTDAVLGAIAPQTEAEGDRAVEAVMIALRSSRATGGDAAKSAELGTAAGRLIRQEPGLTPQQAFDLAGTAMGMQGGMDALASVEKNYGVMRNLLPDASPMERARESISLGALFSRGNMGAEAAGTILSKLDAATARVQSGDMSQFEFTDPLTGKKVTNVPQSLLTARNGIEAMEGLFAEYAQQGPGGSAEYAIDKIMGEQARRVAGLYATGDLTALRANAAASEGNIERREERTMGDPTAAKTINAAEAARERERGVAFREARRTADQSARLEARKRDIEERYKGDFGGDTTAGVAIGAAEVGQSVSNAIDFDARGITEEHARRQAKPKAWDLEASREYVPPYAQQGTGGPSTFDQNAAMIDVLERIAENTSRTQTVVVTPSGDEAVPQEL